MLAAGGDDIDRTRARALLADTDKAVRFRAAQGLAGKQLFLNLEEQVAGDLELLKKVGIETNEAELLAFLRKRTLRAGDQTRLRDLVADLGCALHLHDHDGLGL